MKKSILIAIAALVASGTYLSLNAQDVDDCGSTGLRRTFEGAGRAPSVREDSRPSVRPETGNYDQPSFAGFGGGAVAAPLSPSTPNKSQTSDQATNGPTCGNKCRKAIGTSAIASMIFGGMVLAMTMFAAMAGSVAVVPLAATIGGVLLAAGIITHVALKLTTGSNPYGEYLNKTWGPGR